MLYTANVKWIAEDEVLVAAGTVFGDVLVWSCKWNGVPSDRMLFSLSGHEGSIFGVEISPILTLTDGNKIRLLASCSDDRTIRIWDISETGDEARAESLPPSQTTASSDTGFRCAPTYEDGNQDQGRADVKPIALAMGHASRIWGVKFGIATNSVPESGLLPIYSFGEDATCQRWSLDIRSALTKPGLNLSHEKTFDLHNGKHLWSRALQLENDKTIIVTGGADSRITIIEDVVRSHHAADGTNADLIENNLMVMETKDILPGVVASASKRNAEVVGRYDFLTPNQLLAITNMGRLSVASIQTGQITWTEIITSDEITANLKNCYVLRATGNGTAILGATTGDLYLFTDSQQIMHIMKLGGRIVEMNIVDDKTAEGVIEFVAHLFGSSGSHVVTVDRNTGTAVSHEKLQGLDERFVAVSASRIGDFLALGSRHGWLTILRQTASGFQRALTMATRSRDAITAIVALPSSSYTASKTLYLLATTRDGMYRIYNVQDKGDTLELELVHETSPPFGPMIEGAWFTEGDSPELMLYGFRSKDFIVWNESRREEVVSMDCGGAHRTFRLTHTNGRYRFAFTRTSKLCIHSQDGVPQKPLKLGIHGREIRAISSNGQCIATGAEDTSIRLWGYSREQGSLKHLACMKLHITGIQRINWLGDEYLFTSAGNEEFFAWRVRQMDSAYTGIAVMCEGVFDDKSPIGDLRIMDFDVSWIDPEARQQGAIITMAFSNSKLKSYLYTVDLETGRGSFSLLGEAAYTGACLTQVRHVGTQNGGRAILTASTDGHLCFWRSTATNGTPFELQWSIKIHQNSIKSLDLCLLNDVTYGVLTGGDDNALAYTLLDVSDMSSLTVRAGYPRMTRSAHAAAINGAVLVKNEASGTVLAVSASNDQQLKTWSVGEEHDTRLRLLSERYSGVADAGDFTVLEDGRGEVVVGGVGLEVWRVGGCGGN
ncbi:hypothetical protein VHEMI04952 [[Torrubiella] hemipterigena]|uniref:WD repeat protein n=1 Tax=[Torrubiella] hemipterigena TaxID=1531966 RepID=A0A0A1T2R1_9HYPO|nr:hypothetical protein VHEMI04952 [[Torrubiella] hemipterigena]